MQLSALLPPLSIPVDPEGHIDLDKMMNLFSALIDYFAPILYVTCLRLRRADTEQALTPQSYSLVASPVLSYSDQILSIHRTKSSQGFSLDIPLIMLVASILKYAFLPPPTLAEHTLTDASESSTTSANATTPPS